VVVGQQVGAGAGAAAFFLWQSKPKKPKADSVSSDTLRMAEIAAIQSVRGILDAPP
jgi:hypothetical protein